MKIKFVFKVLPTLVFYGSKVDGGKTRGIFIRINKKYLNDRGLLEHELTHVKQFYKLPIIHSLLYLLIKNYRYECELEAYVEQLRWYSLETHENKILRFSNMLLQKYHLDVLYERIEKDLRKKYEEIT